MISNLGTYSFKVPTGLNLSTQSVPNGNMLLSTAQLVFLTEGDPSFVNSIYYAGLFSFIPLNDLAMSRYTNSDQNTSVDDYIGIACIPYFARKLYFKATSRYGFLDVNYPNVSINQFMFRFQGFWQHMKISAGITVGPVGRLMWALSIVMAAREPFNNQDSWIQSHLMVLVKERAGWKSIIGDLAVRYWRAKKGSKTTSEIMAEYTRIPDHPLVQCWKPYK